MSKKKPAPRPAIVRVNGYNFDLRKLAPGETLTITRDIEISGRRRTTVALTQITFRKVNALSFEVISGAILQDQVLDLAKAFATPKP